MISDIAAPDPGRDGNDRPGVGKVSSPGNPDTGAGAARAAAVSVPRPPDRGDPWLRTGPSAMMALPRAGQRGHGKMAFVRRQPARIVDGRFEGGCTGVFELICPGCGDHPYLGRTEIPPRLQRLRRPRTLRAALDAYHQHLGLLPGPARTDPEASDAGSDGQAGVTRDYHS